MDKKIRACRCLVELVLDGRVSDSRELNLAKKEVCQRFGLDRLPGNSEILAVAGEDRGAVLELLRLKPVRTVSGVAVVAVMTSPAPCPHGRCLPCPGGPDSVFRSPQSYMGEEPAARRAFQHGFDPYRQVESRLRQLGDIGHRLDKVELIVMGGTFTARTQDYQEWFVRRCLEALNDYPYPPSVSHPCSSGSSLSRVQSLNETSRVRNVGLTVETRPDWAKERHVDVILGLGGTKVELGVQTTHNHILGLIRRGHTVEDVVEANRRLRDSGLKVGFHMMPGLPGSTPELDLESFREVFSNPGFMPDYLKIYPTLVTPGTPLHRLWEEGEYQPYDLETTVRLVASVKAMLPGWVRLQRVQRDIPAHQIVAGVKKSNLRQLAQRELARMGERCCCIRCREVGHRLLEGVEPGRVELCHETYQACGGEEHFISFEDQGRGVLVGFIRLRFPHLPHRPELKGDVCLVRELHVYGPLAPLGENGVGDIWQHRGYGEELLEYAEETGRDAGFKKIAVTSGVGVRPYYRRHGYHLEGVYMVKEL